VQILNNFEEEIGKLVVYLALTASRLKFGWLAFGSASHFGSSAEVARTKRKGKNGGRGRLKPKHKLLNRWLPLWGHCEHCQQGKMTIEHLMNDCQVTSRIARGEKLVEQPWGLHDPHFWYAFQYSLQVEVNYPPIRRKEKLLKILQGRGRYLCTQQKILSSQ